MYRSRPPSPHLRCIVVAHHRIISDCSGRIYRNIQHCNGFPPRRGTQSHRCRHCLNRRASLVFITWASDRNIRDIVGALPSSRSANSRIPHRSIWMASRLRCARSSQRTRRCSNLSVNARSADCGNNGEDFTVWWAAPERLAAPHRVCRCSRCRNEHFRSDGCLAVR